MKVRKILTALAACGLAGLFSGVAEAGTIPYANTGHQNLTNYTFTATSSGEIGAYFLGSSAAYTETLGLLVNGVSTGISGLENHHSAIGQYLDLGYAHAGDSLTFFINVATTGDTFYSDLARNADGINHVYSTSYAGSTGIPAGVYVAFEDLRNGGDFNYFDETFAFTNVTSGSKVPAPATAVLLALGLGLLHTSRQRQSGKVTA